MIEKEQDVSPAESVENDQSSCCFYNIRMRSSFSGKHHSGGEEILGEEDLIDGVLQLLKRGLDISDPEHRKELFLSIKIDALSGEKLRRAPLLPVRQLHSTDGQKTRAFLKSSLAFLLKGISPDPAFAIQKILSHVDSFLEPGFSPKWGALIVTPEGELVDLPGDGVRTTHIGMGIKTRTDLMTAAESCGITGRRFPEALMLASKVLSQDLIHLEICLSDDPFYTTGYIAAKGTGYIRLPHLKIRGIPGGGRIYLLNKSPDQHELAFLIAELQGRAFLFDHISEIHPPQSSNDLLSFLRQETR